MAYLCKLRYNGGSYLWEGVSGVTMAQGTDNTRVCALCGQEFDTEHFHIAEHWTRDEVEARNIGSARLERADVDEGGNHTFYFCRWRHLGDFLSECGLESRVLREKEELTHRDSSSQ